MGSFKHRTQHFLVKPTKGLFSLNLTTISLILLCSAFVYCSTGFSEPKDDLPWPQVKIKAQVENFILDETDGSLILTSHGKLYKYSNELELLGETSTSTSSQIKSNGTVRVNKLLLSMSKSRVLISCWQTDNLNCEVLSNDLSQSRPLKWESDFDGFKIHPNDIVLAFVDQASPERLLIAASKMNPLEAISSTIALARFRFETTNPLVLQKETVLNHIDPSSTYEYVYVFEHSDTEKNHTYFIINDYQEPYERHLVRMARICHPNDVNISHLMSYTEISIGCANLEKVHAKAAYFDSSGDDPKLFVVFEDFEESSHRTSYREPAKGSHFCSYSMKLLDEHFHQAISACYNGDEKASLLSKFAEQDRTCQRNPSSDWCSSKLNPYIDGTSPLFQALSEEQFTIQGITSVNFIHKAKSDPVMPDSKDVLYVGTATGLLTKLDTKEGLYYTVDVNQDQIRNYQLDETQVQSQHYTAFDGRITRYVANHQYIYAASETGKISRLDTNKCYYYKSCKSCLSARDQCGDWCGSSCKLKQECRRANNSEDLVCPPSISKFMPKSGPLTGNTTLVIEGENFGTSKGNLTVKLNDSLCKVASRGDNLIICSTGEVRNISRATLNVNVSDESTPVYSKGLATSKDLFIYTEAKVDKIYQEGSNFSVKGQNLDIGSTRSIRVHKVPCDLNGSVQTTSINCSTKPFPVNYSSDYPFFELIIDGRQQVAKAFDVVTRKLPLEKDAKRGLHFTSIHIVFIATAVSLVVILVIKCKVTKLRIKVPSIFKPSQVKANDDKVSFRNPQSQRFTSTNPNGSSSTGLVKINGSIISSDYFGRQDQLDQDQPLMNTFMDNDLMSLLVAEKILIERSRLTLGHVLGSGQFGRVYKGFLKDHATGEHEAVAVKTLHNRSSWDDDLDNRAFVEEGLMMRDFQHENVLALVGVTFDSNGLPMVITPFMLYGDLRSYISDEASSPTVKELIDFGTQVAKGMAYLSGLKFVHRDLAARNCMLDDNLIVKVADFGLSRDIYERDYYSSDNKKTKLPVKWMAIESLEKCIYNTKTDVWSYGVLLWELMTRGVVPYPDVDNFDLFSYLKEGRRMMRPRYCPLILYNIMLSCWEADSTKRPTFEQLVLKVSNVIAQLKIAKDGQQKVSKDITYCDVLSD